MNLEEIEFLRTLGDRLRERRSARGLTQGQLGEHCGLHRTFIGSVERGEPAQPVFVVLRSLPWWRLLAAQAKYNWFEFKDWLRE